MVKYFIFPVFLFAVLTTVSQTAETMKLEVNAKKVAHQMKGGIGASWHSMIHEIPLENEKYEFPVREENPRGSAYGGNPPLENTSAWNQLYEHASWLGLNFLRVELSQRMYEPERNAFDWENEEMKALYRILDWCEENGADVFLQQMWGYVDWNAHPGVHPLLSSPRSLDDFAHGIATLLKYLTETRNYSCIKYFCMTNEPPGGPWGYWWESGNQQGPSVADAWQKLHETFKEQDVRVLLSGPDWTSLPPLEPDKLDFQKYLDAFDIHSYFGIYNKGESVVKDWVEFADQKNKPFFITEIGNMDLGWGTDNPGPKTFRSALSNASDIAVCINLGVDGLNRWSFTNRGDMDGQWQLVKTYDRESNTYTENVTPEKEAYYGYGMLTRFLGKYASVLDVKTDNTPEGLLCTAWKNRDGNLSVLMVNNRKETVDVDADFEGVKHSKFNLYQVTENRINNTNFKLNSLKSFKKMKSVKAELPAESITILTTYNLRHTEPGIIE